MLTTSKLSIDKFLNSLDKETTVLTPNRRLAATLKKQYATLQQSRGIVCWETIDILPISSWLERLWSAYTTACFDKTALLLTALQESILWEKIVVQSKDSHQLLQITQTARLAKTAWTLLKQWAISAQDPLFQSAEDYITFQQWGLAFEALCKQKNYLSSADLPALLAKKIKVNKLAIPSKLLLVGFTELTPQIKNLLQTCALQGTTIKQIEWKGERPHCQRIRLLDEDDEITQMAHYAKQRYMQNPAATIVCVQPNLESTRDRVHQIFSEIFIEPNRTEPQVFNISAGKPLSQYPVIYTALQLLGLYKKKIPLESFSALLRSPHIGESEQESLLRSQCDYFLRQENINTVDLSTAIQFCPKLSKRIQKWLEIWNTLPLSQSYQGWVTDFNRLLTAIGWPGERSLNSEEYQTVENWLNLLTEVTRLDQILEPVSFQEALRTVTQLATQTIFQAQTPEANIQVLGILEAASLPADYLWISGMDDLTWPPQPQPNPFIPKALQRLHQMPHATAQRELWFCNTILNQFKQCAREIVFSYAEKNADLEVQISPLIRDIKEVDQATLGLSRLTSFIEQVFASTDIEHLSDEVAPAVQPNEKINGGMNVIKHQALCPFRSFSEWRLHAHALEQPLPGLSGKDRGNIIHLALQHFWKDIQDHQTLSTASESTLRSLLDACINHAIENTRHARLHLKKYLHLEKQRLQHLLWDWIQIEKNRPPFKVVQNEQKVQLTLDQLTLSIRIDRVDELADGKKLVIDYKTGKYNEPNHWFSDRPPEPQLPLYALLDPHNTIGISFAQIASAEMGFKGVSHADVEIKGIKALSSIKKNAAGSWPEQISTWQTTLTRLGEQFYNGVAKVDPKDNQTCTWCALKSLCRINEDRFS